jgi:hypothetical protein
MARPTVRGAAAVIAACPAFAAAGCGAGARTPSLSRVPLVTGAQVVATHQVCDKGANAYCDLQVVVLDSRFATSLALVGAQRRLLRERGWTTANADTGDEHAAQSPDDALRLTYATGYNDLRDIGLGWIGRGRNIQLALSHAYFARRSAMSILLELGPG